MVVVMALIGLICPIGPMDQKPAAVNLSINLINYLSLDIISPEE